MQKSVVQFHAQYKRSFQTSLYQLVGLGSPEYANKMFHESFYISVTDPENDYEEIIYSDNSI
jgi:predicted component of type VI protein secretion system